MTSFTEMQSQAERVLVGAGILPVLTVDSVQQAIDTATALLAGGLTAIELTLRTPASLDALRALKEQFPGLAIGAGTVLKAAQVDAVCAIGVDFIITPGVSPALLDVLLAANVPVIPGAATPSELMALEASGFRVAKLFPAAVVGGVGMLKALQGPLPQMKLCPTGGIDEGNAAEYLAQPNVACIGGSWMVPKAWLQAGAYDRVTESAARAAAIIKSARRQHG